MCEFNTIKSHLNLFWKRIHLSQKLSLNLLFFRYNTKKNLEKCSAEHEEKVHNLKEHDIKYETIIKERLEKEKEIKEEMA